MPSDADKKAAIKGKIKACNVKKAQKLKQGAKDLFNKGVKKVENKINKIKN
jgi:uncharacterized membrane protein